MTTTTTTTTKEPDMTNASQTAHHEPNETPTPWHPTNRDIIDLINALDGQIGFLP